MNIAPRTAVLVLVLVPCFSACGGGGGGGSGGGGGGGGGGETIDQERSEFHVLPAFGTPADGLTEVELAVRLLNTQGAPIAGARLDFAVSGLANVLGAAPLTDADGRTRVALASFAGQKKSVRATAYLGARATELGERAAEFLEIPEGTYFVRTAGSDAADGRSPRTAWRTLAHALANLPAGGTLHIGAGSHPGGQIFTLQAPTATPSVLSGDRDGHWTGDAGEVRLEGGTAALSLVGARNVLLTGLTFTGAEVGLALADVGAVLVRDCRASENGRGISAVEASELALEDCRISANRQDGVELSGIDSARFQNNLVYGNGASGIVFHSAVTDMLVRFNTFHANGGDHLREEAPGSSGAIEDNIFSAGGSGVFDLSNGSVLTTDRNLVWGNEEAGSDPIVADPAFLDPDGTDGILGGSGAADDDFRLRADSGALDASTLEARAVRLAGREYLAARSSRADGLADGSLADLAAANLGFHVGVPLEPHAALPAGAERLYIADGHGPAPRALALAVEAITGSGAPALGHAARWTLARRSPLERPEELVVVALDTGLEGALFVRRHDGRGWSDAALSPFQVGIAREALVDRGFDLEHEGRAGRALFVWANSAGLMRFQVHVRGRWSAVREVPPLAGPERRVRWVELVPRAGTDELALLLLDDERRLTAALWDGSNFAVPRLVASGVLHRPGWRPFDGAFESVSGDLVVAWGFDVFAESLRWTELVRASGTWREGLFSSAEAVSADVELASDPTSDRIAAVLGEADLNDDVAVCVWDGGAWIDAAELTLAGGSANRLREILWLGASGVALVAYPATDGGVFRFALHLEHGWRVQPSVTLPGLGRAAALELLASADGSATGVVLGNDGALHALRFEERAFSLLGSEAPLVTGLDPAARVFALGRR